MARARFKPSTSRSHAGYDYPYTFPMYWWKMVLEVFSSLQFFDIFVEEWSQTTNRSENSRLIMFENELNFDLSRAHIGSQNFSAK